MIKLERMKLFYSKEMWMRIFHIAKKEYIQQIRNPWVICVAILFLILSVTVSYYGTAVETSDEWRDMEHTVRYLAAYVEYMVPLIALIMGYSSIVGEKERGTLELLFAYPLDRGEVLSGKFLGLWLVLVTCVVSGLGLGGFIISRNIGQVVWSEYYLFILASILLGGVYLSLSMMLSVIFNTSSSALAGSIFTLFLFSFIWLFSMYALAEMTFGWSELELGRPPRWYFGLQFFNPMIIWYTLLALNIPAIREWAMEFAGAEPEFHPSYYDTWIMISILIVWIAVPLLTAEHFLKKQDM